MSDLISRAAAIEALGKIFPADTMRNDYTRGVASGAALATIYIKRLPSAQPDIDEWCTDCKEYDKVNHCCPRFNRVIRKTVEDLKKECKPGRWIEEHIDITDKEHPKSFRFYRCSACGHVAAPALFVDKEKWLSYCPHCGADMRGEQDD